MSGSYRVQYRPAASAGDWVTVAAAPTVRSASDELASWCGPRLMHGDLGRVVRGRDDRLYVFSGPASSFVRAGRRLSASAWEGHGADADWMMRASAGAHRDRLSLAALDCAELAVRSVGDRGGAGATLRTARRFMAGAADERELMDAVVEAEEAGEAMHALGGGEMHLLPWAAAFAAESLSPARHAGLAAGSAVSSVQSSAVVLVEANEPGLTGVQRRAALAAVARLLAPVVARRIPLSAAACASLGLRDPLPPPAP